MVRINTQRGLMHALMRSGAHLPWATVGTSAVCLELPNGGGISFRAAGGILEIFHYEPSEISLCRQVADTDT